MTKIKYNLEYEAYENQYRKLDPIGKLQFNNQVVASKSGNVHTVDLSISSNFIVKIIHPSSWIEFINWSGVHRFDILIEVTANILTNSIRFGNGEKEYYKPQEDEGTIEDANRILPYLFWPYDDVPIRAWGRDKGSKSLLTVRYGYNLLGNELVEAFNVVSYKWYK